VIFCLVERQVALMLCSWEFSRPGEIYNKEIDSGNNCVQIMVEPQKQMILWESKYKGINRESRTEPSTWTVC